MNKINSDYIVVISSDYEKDTSYAQECMDNLREKGYNIWNYQGRITGYEVLDKIDNRYYLVGTVAKRAREIIDGAEVYVSAKNRDNNKPVTIATQEVADEKITFRLLTQEEIDKKEEVIIEEHTTEEE